MFSRLTAILAFAAILLGLSLWYSIDGPHSPFFRQSYFNQFLFNQAHLKQSKGQQRIVLLGASSMGWGFSAKNLTELTGRQVINLGIFGGLGFENTYAYYRENLDPRNDLLVVSPEYGYIENSPTTLTEVECFISLLDRGYNSNTLKCMMFNFKHVTFDLLYSAMKLELPYFFYHRVKYFNEYGDYTYAYEKAGSPGFRISGISLNEKSPSILRYQNFLKQLKSDNFQVLYIPTSVPKEICRNSQKDLFALNKVLARPVDSNFDQNFPFCMQRSDFYDTIYHLSYQGLLKKQPFIEASIKKYLSQK